MNFTNYDIERLLLRAAGLDDFSLYLMHQIDALEDKKNSEEISSLDYISIYSQLEALKKVQKEYSYYKRNEKLSPEAKRETVSYSDM